MTGKIFTLILTITCFQASHLFTQPEISTVDFNNFWKAYDLLQNAKTKNDSIGIFQKEYFDKATKDNKKFIKYRQFTAEEVVRVIQRYPRYFSSIREKSYKIEAQVTEINEYLLKMSAILPGFTPPRICFAFGCMRTAGTVSKNAILIGTEMIIADTSSCFDELGPWLKSVISKTGHLTPLIVHEAAHTYQKNKYTKDLASTVMKEGFAEFVTRNLMGLDNSPAIHRYGEQHECRLWEQFISDHKKGITDFSDWVYGGSSDENIPADLGYYIGLKIIEDHYSGSEDKTKTLQDLSDCKNYNRIFRSTKYSGNCDQESK